mmetsp:Transcript_45969/g.33723  ORF Transcript_45969/g.33723 Transcript_45969/m.33723 type:complete len:101 (-) Transcript_45969:589-891(-)
MEDVVLSSTKISSLAERLKWLSGPQMAGKSEFSLADRPHVKIMYFLNFVDLEQFLLKFFCVDFFGRALHDDHDAGAEHGDRRKANYHREDVRADWIYDSS